MFGFLTKETIDQADIALADVETGDVKILLSGEQGGGAIPTITASGHLLLSRGDTLWAAPLDSGNEQLLWELVPVLKTGMLYYGIYSPYRIAGDGTLVHLQGTVEGLAKLTLINRDGRETVLASRPNRYVSARLSPDGTRVAATIGYPFDNDVWIYTIARNTLTRLTSEGGNHTQPIWSPDSRQVAYGRGDGSFFSHRADGTGNALVIASGEYSGREIPWQWTLDGKHWLVQRSPYRPPFANRWNGTSKPPRQPPASYGIPSSKLRWLEILRDVRRGGVTRERQMGQGDQKSPGRAVLCGP